MPNLVYAPWKTQPPPGTPIDPRFGPGIAAIGPNFSGGKPVISNFGSLATGVGQRGVALINASGTGRTITSSQIVATNKYTIITFCEFDTTGSAMAPMDQDITTGGRVFQYQKNGAEQTYFIPFDTSGNPYFATSTASVIPAAKTPVVQVARLNYNVADVWMGGLGRATVAIGGSGVAQSLRSDVLHLMASEGAGASGATFAKMSGRMYGWALMFTALSDAKVLELSANFWALFAPAPHRSFFDGAAAGPSFIAARPLVISQSIGGSAY